MKILLIHPPVVRACEPPAGIASLLGTLRARGVVAAALDANLEGQLWLLSQPHDRRDRWSVRASRNLVAHLCGLRGGGAYAHPDTYGRAVGDLDRLLAVGPWAKAGWRPSLTDLGHGRLSPVRRCDLQSIASTPSLSLFFPYFAGRLEALLERDSFDCVGFSLNYLSQALTCFAMAGFLRQQFRGLRLILGGSLVTSWLSRQGPAPDFSGLFDHVISGPGEEVLIRLTQMGDGDDRPSGIDRVRPGGAHRGSREDLFSALPDYSDLWPDKGPRPSPRQTAGLSAAPLAAVLAPRAGSEASPGTVAMEDASGYLSPARILPYSSSRGCFWAKCSFCPESVEKRGFLSPPPRSTCARLAELSDLYSPGLVHLLDNALSPALLKALATHPVIAPWYGFARIGPPLTDAGFCRDLRRSGCVMLQLGLEAGDQEVLDRLQKGVSLTGAERVLANLTAAGIATYVYLLFGTPWETEAAARRTLDFVARHHETIGFLNLAIFNLPASGEEARLFPTGSFYEGDLDLYLDFRHPGGWGRREVRCFLDQDFRRHPAIGPILRRDPPAFTSSHAAFFTGSFAFRRTQGRTKSGGRGGRSSSPVGPSSSRRTGKAPR